MSFTILPRSAWTGTAPGFARFPARRLDPNAVTIVAPHYPADGAVTYGPEPTLAHSAARLRAYRNYHVNHLGWADIGYPMAIDQAGRIFTCAGLSFASAHSASPGFPDANYRVTAVLFIIGNNERPSAKAIAAFRNLCRWMKDNRYPNLATRPIPHGNLRGASTSCAGPEVRRLIPTGSMDIPTGAVSAPAPAASNPVPAKPSAPAASTKPWPAGRGPWPDAYLTVTGNRNEFQDRALFKLLGDAGYDGATLAIRLQKRLRASGDYKGTITAQSQIGPQTIQAWQRFLKARGHYNGSITAQSQWGPQTTRATVNWLNQQAREYHK